MPEQSQLESAVERLAKDVVVLRGEMDTLSQQIASLQSFAVTVASTIEELRRVERMEARQ